MRQKVSALIPAYNEEKKIVGVLKSLTQSPLIDEIIVVDDGSTDSTSRKVKSFSNIRLVNNGKNRGKGYAIARGIEEAKGNIVLFVDADIIGLKPETIKNLITPLTSGNYDWVIGYRSSRMEKSVGVPLSGERAYFRKDLLPFTKVIEKKAYAALELYLNDHFKHKRKKIIHLKGVYSTPKHKKYSYTTATRLYIHETYKLFNEILSHRDTFSYFRNSYLRYVYFKDKNLLESMRVNKLIRATRYLRLPL